MTTTEPVATQVQHAPVADPRLRGAGAPRLRAGAAHQARQGRRRHQDATSTSTPVGCSSGRCRCGTPTSGSAPSPTRTSATCSRWARTTGSCTCSACPRGCRSDCGSASILFGAALGMLFLLRTLHVRGPGAVVATRRVHAHAVHARLLGAHLGDPAAVGRPAVDAGAHDPRAARGDKRGAWKYAGDLRHRRAGRRRRERDRAGVRGDRAGALDRLRGA